MGNRLITDEELWAVYVAHDSNAYTTAKHFGMTHRNIAYRCARLKEKRAAEPKLPTFPDPDIPITDVIEHMGKRFATRHLHEQAKRWFTIKMPAGPFGLLLWGDPHIDSNGCNWPLLQKHIEIARRPHVYSLNIGDTLDNWPNGSRLIRLYAHSDQSVETATRLARWFLEEAGIYWLLLLLGNHDLWPGHTNIKHLVKKPIIIEEWGARFILSCGNAQFRIWAQHDFPGQSMWNALHGLQRAAHMKDPADLYVSGHKHNWALHQEESASKGFVYWLARARGYKYIDDHAQQLGHDPQQEGASILAVFNPAVNTMAGRLMCFSDVEQGADYLGYLRSR